MSTTNVPSICFMTPTHVGDLRQFSLLRRSIQVFAPGIPHIAIVNTEDYREFVDRFRFESRSEAKRVIISWINNYNALRQHSSLNNLSPIEWELQFARRQLQAA